MNWFSNLKVRNKFLLIVSFILLFLLTLSAVGLWGTASINGTVERLNNDQIPEIIRINQAQIQLQVAQSNIELALLEKDQAQIEKLTTAVKGNVTIVEANLRAYIATSHPAEERDLVNTIEAELKTWVANTQELSRLALTNTSETDELGLELTRQDSYQKLANVVAKVISIDQVESIANKEQASSTFITVIMAFLAVSLIVIIITLFAVLILSQVINKPLLKLRQVMNALASGDLTQQVVIQRTDELGELAHTYNSTLQALRSLVSQIHTQSQQVANATDALGFQARTQVDSTSQQTNAIAQATQSLQELNQTTQEIAIQATHVATSIQNTLRQAHLVNQVANDMAMAQQQGRLSVARTIQALFKLKERIGSIEQQQQELVEQSSVIEGVINLIDGIARETHLLALNAAIEAASAGQYGDRFAIIATEVKRLADNSVRATVNVRKSLEGIVTAVERSSQSAMQGVQEAEKASSEALHSDGTLVALNDLSDQVTTAAHSIVGYIERTASLTSSIETATQQQRVSSQQLLETMRSIEALTVQTLNSVRYGETSTQQLSLTAQSLKHSADNFKLNTLNPTT